MLAYEQLRESVLGRNTDGSFPLWYEAHRNAFSSVFLPLLLCPQNELN